MPFRILLTEDAGRDLSDLYEYIARRDSQEKAGHVLNQIEKAFLSLEQFPERGAYPKELVSLGIREYREVFFKPYRILYKVIEKSVYVMLISDGRRDMQTLLQRRLLMG